MFLLTHKLLQISQIQYKAIYQKNWQLYANDNHLKLQLIQQIQFLDLIIRNNSIF
uniref:Uncharacterized protein n=1 Tax=Meloidogyne incognita TaxID=6306 RepID=A0A914KGK5_MELIC